MKHILLSILLFLPLLTYAQCTPQPAPYVQNFDYITTFPQCTFHRNATIEAGGRTGNRLSMLSGDTTDAYILFPELQIPSDSVEIVFWVRSATYRNKAFACYLGFVTDTTDIGSSFLTLKYDSVKTTEWMEIRFNTANNPYPTTATARFAIYLPAGVRANLYVDDIDIHHTPTCLRPENVRFPHKTSSTFDIAWDGGSTARIDVTDFATTTSHHVTTNPATITNLQPYTQYTVTVRTICAPGDTSVSSVTQTITTHPNCPHPNNLSITNVHSNDFRLSWTSTYGNANFHCDYKLYEDSLLADSSSFNTTARSHTFTNLAPTTNYTLTGRIYNDCGNGNHSDTVWFNYTFTTLCHDIGNVYFSNITDTTAVINVFDPSVTAWCYALSHHGEDPDTCPTKYLTAMSDTLRNLTPGTTYYVYTRRICGQAQSPWSPVYTFTTTGVTPHGQCLEPCNRTMSMLSETAVTVDWTDPASALSWIVTIYPSSGHPYVQYVTQHPAYIVGLDTALAYTFYVSAVCSSVDTSQEALIGNIPAHRIVCYALPYAPSMVSVSDSSLTVWGRRYGQNSLQFAIAPYPSHLPSDTLYSITAGDTVTFNGLTPGTTYTIYMRGICRNAYNTDTTEWISASLTTTQGVARPPFVCGFEDTAQNNRWQYVQTQTNQFVIGSAVANGGTRSLYVSHDGASYSYNINATSYASAYYTLSFTAGDYDYSFDWRCMGHTDYGKARFLLLPTSVAMDYTLWTGYLGNGRLPAGAIALDNGALSGSNTFSNVSGSFHISASGTYNIVATWRNFLSSGTNPPIAIDNISVIPQPCTAPGVTLVSQHGSSATFNITGAVAGSQILYGISTSTAEPAIYDTVAATSSSLTLTLDSLSGSTNYTLYVRNVCTSGGVSQPATLLFVTDCGMVSAFPYRQSFETLTAGSSSATMLDPICWSVINYGAKTSGSTIYPTMSIATNQHTDGGQSLEMTSFRGEPLFMVLPEIDDITLTKLDFDFKTESSTSSCGLITAGYMTNPADTATFVAVTGTARNSTWTSYQALFTNAPAGSRIALKFHDANIYHFYSYIDNVSVTRMSEYPAFNDTICENTDYTLHGFYIPSSQLPLGDTTVYSVQQSGGNHVIYKANLHIVANQYSVVYDTTPAYKPYVKGAFNITNPQTYFYYASVPSHYGCDSTIELHLTVTLDSLLDTVLCHGERILVGDTMVTTPDTVVRTWSDHRGMIVTIYAKIGYYDVIHTDTAIVLTDDTVYYWEGVPYSSPGVYTRTFTSVTGCDSTVTLTLSSVITSVVDLYEGVDVMVVPNPVSAGGVISITGNDIEQVTIFTAAGQKISSFKHDDVIVAPSVAGVYYIRINNGITGSIPIIVR